VKNVAGELPCSGQQPQEILQQIFESGRSVGQTSTSFSSFVSIPVHD